MTTRTRGSLELTNVTRVNTFYKVETGAVDWTSTSSASIRNGRVMKDVSTPGFTKVSASGGVIISPMSIYTQLQAAFAVPLKVFDSRGRLAWESTNFGGPNAVIRGDFGQNDSAIYQSGAFQRREDLETLALTAAYAQAGKSDVDLLVSLGELKETLQFLHAPLDKALRMTQKAKRYLRDVQRIDDDYARNLSLWKRNGRGAKPFRENYPTLNLGGMKVNDVPSMWLAYRYGLMPLIYDVQAWEEFLSKLNDKPKRVTTRATEKYSGTWTQSDSPVNDGQLIHYFHTELSYELSVRAGVLCCPIWDLPHRLGTAIDRVPAAAYELIPLSFVADWFWNGSKFYDALTVQCRTLSVLGSWTTAELSWEVDRSREVTAASGYSIEGGAGPCFFERCKVKTRNPKTLASIGILFFANLNAKRIADGLALIHTFLRTRR